MLGENGTDWFENSCVAVDGLTLKTMHKADSRLALQSNGVSHRLGANLESALMHIIQYKHNTLGYGLSPIQCQDITWTNADLLQCCG